MNFITRLILLMKEKGVSRNKLCADLDIGKNSVADWEKRGNIPDGEVLVKIAQYFSVTTDYLLGRTDDPHSLGDPDISNERVSLDKESMDMAQRIKKLPRENQARMLDYLALLEGQDNP